MTLFVIVFEKLRYSTYLTSDLISLTAPHAKEKHKGDIRTTQVIPKLKVRIVVNSDRALMIRNIQKDKSTSPLTSSWTLTVTRRR